MGLAINKVHQGDCIELLDQVKPGSIDLAFADPPFNIGYQYDVYHDRARRPRIYRVESTLDGRRAQSVETGWDVLAGNRRRVCGRVEAESPGSGFPVPKLGHLVLHLRSELHAGVQSIAYASLPFCERPAEVHVQRRRSGSAGSFGQAVGVCRREGKSEGPPARQHVDPPAAGLPEGFEASGDTWFFSRVAGTFKEREGFHGCQMPEQLLGRIIRCCSNAREIVLDPFGGSGTTFAVAKKLGRRWIGFELSEDYVAKIESRLSNTKLGQPLDGTVDPLTSAPPTPHVPKTRQRRAWPKSKEQRTLLSE